jgi:cold shock CspA family protein
MRGKVVKLFRDKGFGFLRSDAGQEFFFHRTALDRGGRSFEELTEGDTVVSFEETKSEKGLRATDVLVD